MAGFLARVELHGGDAADYRALHKQMKVKGFNDGWNDSGVDYDFPPATYYGVFDKTIPAVLADVTKAAQAAGFDPDHVDTPGTEGTPGTCAIVVVESAGGAAAGLKRSD